MEKERDKVKIYVRVNEEEDERNMTVLWDIAACSPVEIYRRFRGAYCLHH
jgi:hypothetical protein